MLEIRIHRLLLLVLQLSCLVLVLLHRIQRSTIKNAWLVENYLLDRKISPQARTAREPRITPHCVGFSDPFPGVRAATDTQEVLSTSGVLHESLMMSNFDYDRCGNLAFWIQPNVGHVFTVLDFRGGSVWKLHAVCYAWQWTE